MNIKFSAFVLFSLLIGCSEQAKVHTLSSPDSSIEVNIYTESEQVRYRVKRDNQTVLESSKLGLQLSDRNLNQHLNLSKISDVSQISQEYQLFSGKQKDVEYNANEQTFTFENPAHQQLAITFRVSDDGVAFKYKVLGDSEKNLTVTNELTSFNLRDDSKAWLQPIAVAQTGWSNTNPSYEEHYLMDIPVNHSSPSEAGWVFPALYRTDNTWLAITEAGITGDYHASRLQAESPQGEYSIGQPMSAEVFTNGNLLATGKLPIETPWRVLAIGSLADVADSTLGTDLAEPNVIANTDFIKPGISSWSWGLLKDDFTVFEVQRDFIDHAADMHWQYMLVDADWDRKIGDGKMQELVNYGKDKGVGVLVWYNSSGEWNTTPYTPKGALLTAESREVEFAKLRNMGIKGVKIDFFAGDGQSMLAYYIDILKDAAKYELLVNFHGATLPRGLHRTYPNLMTAEAVKGFEMITFNQGDADLEASHSAMLPFARNLFDPMDFTPTTFNDIPNIQRKTSNAFELAQSVLFVSGIQHIVETPEGMKNAPYFVKNLLREIPASWDESRYIAGTPGKLAVFARRSGSIWYVAGVNGENIDKNINLDLSFLMDKEGQIIKQGPRGDRSFAQVPLIAAKNTTVSLKGNDGFVMVFK